MHRFDYHHHTNHSFDSRETMVNVCEKAAELKLDVICFTEHFTFNPNVPTYGHMDWEAYEADIANVQELYKGKLEIRKGIELCEPNLFKERYEDLFRHKNIDYILGSVHNVDDVKLRKVLAAHGKNDAYRLYFERLLTMVTEADIDVIAHLDLIKRYQNEAFSKDDFALHADIITAILQTAIRRGIGLEVNTSTIEKLGEPMPARAILELYHSLGGIIITYGSDSHSTVRTGEYMGETMEMLKQVGFDYVYTFKNRKAEPHEIEVD
ncbi:histidinol-phosphatase HisJ family protein [Paenalkalicoccus suaedae]|uniref:Histidinol-phosphatase n=1 Tax=Paenalkalicoccus suaedae TaxID=2592382 RepID=A0A859FJR4_9BACI|nr:histidinol-phosphatase HisJ family protein [Paenalkalicoccus suaedae]QKS73045.1 histidinol-phosphatase HisJ family protein [Paenalkalicoccus suaedae]